MKTDIVIAGVGGQGILSIAVILGTVAVNNNLNIKHAEVHGMSQRGGAVYSHVRVSDSPVASDLIPLGKADLVLSVEPLEAMRYIPYLSPQGKLVTNIHSFVNMGNYPEPQNVLGHLKSMANAILIDAEALASKKASNMVMLGAAAPFIDIATVEFEKAINSVFEAKGQEVIEMNINAFREGFRAAKEANDGATKK